MRLSICLEGKGWSGECRAGRERRVRCEWRCLWPGLGGWRRVLCAETVDRNMVSGLRGMGAAKAAYHIDGRISRRMRIYSVMSH